MQKDEDYEDKIVAENLMIFQLALALFESQIE